MKQMEVIEKTIGENTFYIKKFPAFTAAKISGDLVALITPIIGSLAPAFAKDGGINASDIMDADISTVLPAMTEAMSTLSGEKVERFMESLLVAYRNVSVEGPSTSGVRVMDYDLANEVFCGELDEMFLLCYEVIKLNFSGFFTKIVARFGNRTERMAETATN